MRLLIDIGHPAHVHLFKHFAHEMIRKGHKIHFTVRNKEFEIDLLKQEGFDYNIIGNHYKSKTGKIWGLFKFTFLVFITAIKFKPDLFLSHGSMYSAIASFFLGNQILPLKIPVTGNRCGFICHLPKQC
jgi:uncharacterized protein